MNIAAPKSSSKVDLSIKAEWVVPRRIIQRLLRMVPLAVGGWAEIVYVHRDGADIQSVVLKDRVNNSRHIISPVRMVAGLATIVRDGDEFGRFDSVTQELLINVRLLPFSNAGAFSEPTAQQVDLIVQAAIFGKRYWR